MATAVLTFHLCVTILVSWIRLRLPCSTPSTTPRVLYGVWPTQPGWITLCWSVFDPGNAKRRETWLRRSVTPWRAGPASANRRNAFFVAP